MEGEAEGEAEAEAGVAVSAAGAVEGVGERGGGNVDGNLGETIVAGELFGGDVIVALRGVDGTYCDEEFESLEGGVMIARSACIDSSISITLLDDVDVVVESKFS